MITIMNSVFDAQGADKKAKVYGITLSGAEDVVIENCEFSNMGYASVLNHCAGDVTIKGCTFNCDNVYNPIEGSQSVSNGNVVVKDCHFVGAPGNNYVNFYQVKDGSKHEISGCDFQPTVDNNVVRISNRTSAAIDLLVKDCKYDFNDEAATDYTGFLLCQDYTNKSGVKQDFTKVSVELDNVLCDGVKVTADGAVKGCVYYVYEDGAGIITGTNDPVVIVK